MACAVIPGPVLRRTSCLVYCSVIAVLKWTLLKGVPHFHVALGPTDDVASFAATGRIYFRQWPEGGPQDRAAPPLAITSSPRGLALSSYLFPTFPTSPSAQKPSQLSPPHCLSGECLLQASLCLRLGVGLRARKGGLEKCMSSSSGGKGVEITPEQPGTV